MKDSKYIGPQARPSSFLDTEPQEHLTGKKAQDIVKNVSTGYGPRKHQILLHDSLKRFNVIICHRRFGKTVCIVNEIIDRALHNPLRNPHYAYIAPTYKQAKKIAWQYFVDYTRHLPGVTTNKSELTIYIERPGRLDPLTGQVDPDTIEITLLGADDPDTIRGVYLDGVALDEFAQCDPIIWGQVVRPALADRKKIARDLGIREDLAGLPLEPWAIFVGTPKGQNHLWHRYDKAVKNQEYCAQYEKDYNVVLERARWNRFEKSVGIEEDTPEKERKKIISTWPTATQDNYKLWRKYITAKSWFTIMFKASETGILDQDEIDEMREDLSPEEIEQELECSFTAAVLGSYYGHNIVQMRQVGRIGNVPHNPRYPVDTYWDIGIGDKAGIWFLQKYGGAVYYINYYESNGKGVPEYKMILDAMAKKVGERTNIDFNNSTEYVYGEGYKYGRHVWPHDGAAREWGTGVSRQETARTLGLIVEIQEKQTPEDRIQAARNRLKISWIDEKKCARGIDCLYNYQKMWDDKLMCFDKKPKHDWTSHGADAFGYSSLDDRPSNFPEERMRRAAEITQANGEYDELAA